MKKNIIYNEVSELLEEIVAWIKNGGKQDFDNRFLSIYEKYGIDSSFGILGELYSYLDIVCDAREHLEKSIANNYGYDQAIIDIEKIISLIKKNQIEVLENDLDLMSRMKKVYE